MLSKYPSKNSQYRFVFFIVICCTILATELSIIFEPIKYLKYVLVLFFVGLLVKRNLKIRIEPTVYAFIILIGFSWLKIWQIDQRLLIESFLILVPVSVFLVTGPDVSFIKTANLLLVLIFFLMFFQDIKLSLSLESFLRSETSDAETNMSSFLFALFFSYFYITKSKKWAFLNFIMVILALKRITFLSVFVVVAYDYFSRLKIFKGIPLLIGINLLFVFVISLLGAGALDNIIFEMTGLPAAHFTQGRSTFVNIIMEGISLSKFEAFFVGVGQGSTLKILEEGLGYHQLLHNDVFKLFWESGIVVFILFFYVLYKFNNRILTVQLNTFMLTDNILIYAPVLFLYLLLSTHIQNETQTRKNNYQDE